jgi:hypothetical protein
MPERITLLVLSSPLKQSLCRIPVFSRFDRYALCFNAKPELAPQLGVLYCTIAAYKATCTKVDLLMQITSLERKRLNQYPYKLVSVYYYMKISKFKVYGK